MAWSQKFHKSEISLDTGVNFADFEFAPVPKFLNPEPGPVPDLFQIWESDSCSDSGYHQSSWEFTHILLKKLPNRLLQLPKLKSDPGFGSGLSQMFDSGTERKVQNPAGVDSGTSVSREISDLCEISDLLLFVRHFAS